MLFKFSSVLYFSKYHDCKRRTEVLICSSVEYKEEHPARFEKRFCLFLALQKVTMGLKTF